MLSEQHRYGGIDTRAIKVNRDLMILALSTVAEFVFIFLWAATHAYTDHHGARATAYCDRHVMICGATRINQIPL